MRRTSRGWIVAGAGLGVGVLAFLPAELFAPAVQRAWPQIAHMALTGSVWNGRGVLRVGEGAIPITWSARFSDLLRLRLGWDVEADAPSWTTKAAISRGFSDVEIAHLEADGDLRTLAHVVPALRLAGLGGIATLRSRDAWRVDPGSPWRATGRAHLTVKSLTLAAMGATPVGDVAVDVDGVGDAIQFKLAKSAGALLVEGEGQFSNAGEWRFKGSALPLSTMDAQARAQLARWAPAGADGRHRLDFNLRW
jgi:hypothetical protein